MSQVAPDSPRRSHAVVLWVIAVALIANAVGLWNRPGSGTFLPEALAQNQNAGGRGVFAFTGQIDHNRFGLFMLDVDQGTVWCYEIDSSGGTRQLRLVAARTFIYDRYLMDFNCLPPSFRTVQELVSKQRQDASGATEREEKSNPAKDPSTTGGAP